MPALTALASADFNGDGLPDLIVGRPDGGLRLILGQGRLSEDPR